MSVIAQLLTRIFRKTEVRILAWGFYGGGSTTALYQMKLGEVVTAIPTIGFNVETLEYQNVNFTIWDLGGRDKIRPLWRHYYHGTHALVFFFDSTIRYTDEIEYVKEELNKFLNEEELHGVPMLMCANKQDRPGAMTAAEVIDKLDLRRIKNRKWFVQETSGVTGEGLYEGLDWLFKTLSSGKKNWGEKAYKAGTEWLSTALTDSEAAVSTKVEGEVSHEASLIFWLERVDSSDDDFLAQFDAGGLDSWDHGNRLRIIWLLLKIHTRSAAKPLIFDGFRRLDPEAFHETLTYFWMHMVHYAMEATTNPTGDFKGFLLMNPQLSNKNLVNYYYTEQIISMSMESRTEVVLPDKQALPSLLSSVADSPPAGAVEKQLPPKAIMDDDEFLERLRMRTLPSWGHEVKLRAIWVLLHRHGRRGGGTKQVLETLSDAEGSGHHLTEAYFWIQMVTQCMAQAPGVSSFAEFVQQPACRPLLRSDFISDYYSDQVLASGVQEFCLPDKKQLSSIIK